MALERSFRLIPKNLNAQQKRVSTYIIIVLIAAFVLAISNTILPPAEPATSNYNPALPRVASSPLTQTTLQRPQQPVTAPSQLGHTSTVLNSVATDANATFVIACGTQLTDAVAEMRPLLTSMLVLVSAPIRLVFLTDADGAARIRRLFATDLAWFRRPLRVDIVHVRDTDIDKFALDIRVDPMGDSHTGRWALAKLMVPWLLPGVDRVVTVDTDMVFVKDPLELWEEHGVGGAEWIYRMPLNRRHSNNAICSCVVLVRCELARRRRVHPTMLRAAMAGAGAAERQWYKPTAGLWRPEQGDQGLLWMTMHKYPAAFSELPLRWNREKCHNYYGVFNSGNTGDVGIFHRNCAGFYSRVATDNASEMFDFFLKYRWHWLRARKSRGKRVEVHSWDPVLPAAAGR